MYHLNTLKIFSPQYVDMFAVMLTVIWVVVLFSECLAIAAGFDHFCSPTIYNLPASLQ
jgi:hypothetical protein